MAQEGINGSARATGETEIEALSAPGEQDEQYEPASAMHIPPPATSLASRPKGKMDHVKVTLLTDPESVLPLHDVTRINETDVGGARTPLMTVIHAVLAENGGTMKLTELTSEVQRYWNRPFPSSPYSSEEFVYVVVTNSDDLRTDE